MQKRVLRIFQICLLLLFGVIAIVFASDGFWLEAVIIITIAIIMLWAIVTKHEDKK